MPNTKLVGGQRMKFNYGLTAALIGVSASVVFIQPQIALALSSAEVAKIAKEITVRIESNKEQGSGVIFQREGNIYYVLTCNHVVKKPGKYKIFTSDGKTYPLDTKKVTTFGDKLDLAVVQFSSSENYTIAKLGNSELATQGTVAYVSGWPVATLGMKKNQQQFTSGYITANASQPLNSGGYALVYNSLTLPGMSGGPVLNDQGEVVGIHGQGDKPLSAKEDPNAENTGFNLGIPINTYLRLKDNPEIPTPPPAQSRKRQSDDFFVQAVSKFKQKDFEGAITAYTQAIEKNLNYAEAYNGRGDARFRKGDKSGALADYSEAIKLNPNFANAYFNRARTYSNLKDKQKAIADYQQAANLYQKQGRQDRYEQAMKRIKTLEDIRRRK
jgi:S1-C subfamily serine protease